MKIFLSLYVGLLFWTSLGRAQVEVAVVIPFDNEARDGKLDWVSESFAEVLSTHLNTSRLLMVDRRERATAFDTIGIPSARILSNATLYKAAEVLDTDRLVLGSFNYQDGVFSASAQVLSMAGPTLSKPFTEKGPLPTLFQIQSALAWQIQKFLRPDFPYSKEEYVADHGNLENVKLEAFEYYIRGLLTAERAARVQLYRAADRVDPRFTKPAFELGLMYFNDRDYQTSILWLAKLRPHDPDYLEANYFLGLAYLYQGQYDRSAAAFRVVEIGLPLNEVYNNLGIALARRDQPGAIQYFQKARQNDPEDVDYAFNLGYAFWRRGDCANAVEHLAPVAEKLNQAPPRAIYADCLKRLGREQEAAEQLRHLPAGFNPADTAGLVNLERPKDKHDAVSFRQLTRLRRIQEELQHSKLSDDNHAELHFKEALDDAAGGLEQEALEELQRVLDYDPQDSRAYRELARLHLKAGRLEEASRAAARALRWNQSAEIHILLAQIQIQQGRKADAYASAARALTLDPSSQFASSMVAALEADLAPPPSSR